MKLNICIRFGLRRGLCAAGLAGALLLAGCLPGLGQTQNSPLGTWDCVMSGSREGIAYITFLDDLTFTAYEVLVPKAAHSQSPSERGDSDPGRRFGTGSSSSSLRTNIFGWETTTGRWGLDIRGRVIGSFMEMAQRCTINTVLVSSNCCFLTNTNASSTNSSENSFCVTQPYSTNFDGTYFDMILCYSNQMVCETVTNQLSFAGRAVADRRLTLVASATLGRVTYSGRPASLLPDISGNYYGIKRVSRSPNSPEFFTLKPNERLNVYDVVGSGPGYSYQGVGLLSSRNRIGFALGLDPDQTVLRAVIGSLNPRRLTAKLHGLEERNGEDKPRINFSIAPLAP